MATAKPEGFTMTTIPTCAACGLSYTQHGFAALRLMGFAGWAFRRYRLRSEIRACCCGAPITVKRVDGFA